MSDTNTANNTVTPVGYNEYRADFDQYWRRLMWYRDELWRITLPVWGVYGAFIASCVGYVWSTEKGKITGEIAGMLIVVIVAFSWVIQRLYWTYAHRVYEAITEINKEVQAREQYLYIHFLKHEMTSDYGRFRVYPELNVIFSIVGIAMMFACLFTVGASVQFEFQLPVENKSDTLFKVDLRLVIELCFALVVIFELALNQLKKYCEVCGEAVAGQKSGTSPLTAQAE